MPYYNDELPEEYAEMGAVMYWKGRAKKAEAENAALRERVAELELQVSLLTSNSVEYIITGSDQTEGEEEP